MGPVKKIQVYSVLGSELSRKMTDFWDTAPYGDDPVNGVRLRLWTAAADGAVFHPQVIYKHGEL
jgi:hypothetical protein